MNSQNFNFLNYNSSNNVNSNNAYFLNFHINSNKEYHSLNSIQSHSVFYNFSSAEENSELAKMKITLLLKEFIKLIECPEYQLNFNLLHHKCFQLNQANYQIQFFEILKNILTKKIKDYLLQLNSLLGCNSYRNNDVNKIINHPNYATLNKNSINDSNQVNNNYNNITKVPAKFFTQDNISNNFSNPNLEYNNNFDYNETRKNKKGRKRFLLEFINIYNKYRIICQKISETINVLNIRSYCLEKLNTINPENNGENINSANFHNCEFTSFEKHVNNTNDEIYSPRFIFKIIFAIFFENIIFEDIIQHNLLDNFFYYLNKIRKNYKAYITDSSLKPDLIQYISKGFSKANELPSFDCENDKNNNCNSNNNKFNIINDYINNSTSRFSNNEESFMNYKLEKNNSSNSNNTKKNLSSNLKLNENTESEKFEKMNSFKYNKNNNGNDTIAKIKGILQKKINANPSNKNNAGKLNDNSDIMLVDEENFECEEQKQNGNNNKKCLKFNCESNTALDNLIKTMLWIFNDSLEFKEFLKNEKLEMFTNKFNEAYQKETKLFYEQFTKSYFENVDKEMSKKQQIKTLELGKLTQQTQKKTMLAKKIQKQQKQDKFSYYDISILNEKSDNDDCFEFENGKYNFYNTNNYVIGHSDVYMADCSKPEEMSENNQMLQSQNTIKEKIFICKKTPKDTFIAKNHDDNNRFYKQKQQIKSISHEKNQVQNQYNNYNTYSGVSEIFDFESLNHFSTENQKTSAKLKTKLKHTNKNMINQSIANIPISIEGFILEISLLIQLEEDLISTYSKREDIIKLILQISIACEETKTAVSGLGRFIENTDLKIIKFLFALFSKCEDLKNNFNNILKSNLNKILDELEKNHILTNKFNHVEYLNFYIFVEEIFKFKTKMYKVLNTSLESNSRSELTIKTSLEKIVNKNFDFMENFIKLIHEEIKIAIKNKDTNRLKDFQNVFLTIFKLFNDKDLFELEYRKYLSKRLLRYSCMVKETEFDFYEILKKESGNIYTRKIEKILNEISASYDLNVEYSRKYSENIKKNFILKDPYCEICKQKKKDISGISTFMLDIKNKSDGEKLDNEIKNHHGNTNKILANYDSNNNNLNFISSNSKSLHSNHCNNHKSSAHISNNGNNNFKFNKNSGNNININNESDKNENLAINNTLNIRCSAFGNFNHNSIFNKMLKKDNNSNKTFNNPINSSNNQNINNNNNNNINLDSFSNNIPHPNVSNVNLVLSSTIFNKNSNKQGLTYEAESNNAFGKNNQCNTKTIYDYETLHTKCNCNIIDLSVKVVSSDSWLLENINIKDNKKISLSEIIKNENFKLPKIIEKYLKNFYDFYNSKFKNRELKWINEYSYAFIDMKAHSGKTYNLISSAYQTSILCLFNEVSEKKELSYSEILEKLSVKKPEKRNMHFLNMLKSHLIAILYSKILLIKNKENEEVTDIKYNDLIYLNKNFEERQGRVKLLNFIIEKKEIIFAEEKKESEISHFILEDRKHQLDAIIIKLLKRNKYLEFKNLTLLIKEELKNLFVPETEFIKQRIENLIDRNFIKRSENDFNLYEYI